MLRMRLFKVNKSIIFLVLLGVIMYGVVALRFSGCDVGGSGCSKNAPLLLFLGGFLPIVLPVAVAHARLCVGSLNLLLIGPYSPAHNRVVRAFRAAWIIFFIAQCVNQLVWFVLGMDLPKFPVLIFGDLVVLLGVQVLLIPVLETVVLVGALVVIGKFITIDWLLAAVVTVIFSSLHGLREFVWAVPAAILFFFLSREYIGYAASVGRMEAGLRVGLVHMIYNFLSVVLIASAAWVSE